MWSSIVGAVGSVIGEGPDDQGAQQAKQQGSHQFEDQLGSGLTVAVDLCSGYHGSRSVGAEGPVGPPDPGDSPKAPFELHHDALAVFGPQPAPGGMTIDVDTDGPARVGLACAEEAERAAAAFVHDRPRELIHTLAQAEVNGHARLHAKPARCKVAVVARSEADKVTLHWQRPRAERARALGGSIVRCQR